MRGGEKEGKRTDNKEWKGERRASMFSSGSTARSSRGAHSLEAAPLNKKFFRGGFPGGAVVENLPANAGDTGSSPGLGRSHMPQSN